jgi:hypothetical protein
MPMSSIRKHLSQMSKSEIGHLFKTLGSVNNWRFSKHALERMDERGAVRDNIVNIALGGELIEYHLKDNRSRVLMRSNAVFHNYVACVVFELKTSRVITVYWNHKDDYHRTINMKAYSGDLDILKCLAESE